MSITQTYYMAHTARSKLSKEAARADHNLRLLVGHANLLDSLMLDLAHAEKEQEQWFNNTVRNATKKAQPQHIKWADTIEEESVEDYSDNDSDLSDEDDYSDYDEEEEDEKFEDVTIHTATAKPVHRAPSPPALITTTEINEEDEDEEEEEEEVRLTLTRSPSRQQSPPELLDDLSSDDDEDMPPSPEQLAIDAFATSTSSQSQPQHPAKRANLLTDPETQSMFEEDGLIQPEGTMIPAY